MLSFKIIRNCYLSVSLASPAAKLTKVRVGQVGFLPRQYSLTIDDDDDYDYNDDDDAWHFFSYHGAYLKTIEDNNSKLEDILDSVHLGYYWYSDQK